MNNLRFSDEFWNTKLICNSGFYTNRLRRSELIEKFRLANFRYEISNSLYWNELPLPIEKLNSRFHNFDESDLKVKQFDVVLYKD